jgi:hypothetical protein
MYSFQSEISVSDGDFFTNFGTKSPTLISDRRDITFCVLVPHALAKKALYICTIKLQESREN